MRPKFKRFVAALVGVATLMSPVTVFAGEYCSTYAQVESGSGGGQFVGGVLMYESLGTYTRSQPTTSVTTTTTANAQVGTSGTHAGNTVTISTTITTPGESLVIQQPVGYYAMNDGSVYEINCITGEETKISDPS